MLIKRIQMWNLFHGSVSQRKERQCVRNDKILGGQGRAGQGRAKGGGGVRGGRESAGDEAGLPSQAGMGSDGQRSLFLI